MPENAPPGDLVSLLEWIDEAADRFEAHWQAGTPPALADFVNGATGKQRLQLLKELIKIDLDWRRRSGQPRKVEDYLADWPDLRGPDGSLPDDLVHFAAQLSAASAPTQTTSYAPQAELATGAWPSPSTTAIAVFSLPCTLGKFQLVELLGQGGFGVVYKARDTELGRTVAVKVPRAGAFTSAEEQERFLREARSAAQLKHPNIVEVFEVANADGMTCIVSSYIEGRDLANLLRERRLAFTETANLVATVADALDYAHRMNVVHRDVNPRNILMDSAGRPHVADFGLALRTKADLTLTAAGQVLGTPSYMSPEQAAGRSHEAGPGSDVYSLGVVLYEMLAGRRPFAEDGPLLFHRIVHEEPRPPRRHDSRIPRDLETICLKALAKAPEQRYTTAAEFADDLRRYLRDEPIRARASGPARRFYRWCRRNPVVAGLTAAVFLSLVLVAAALLRAVHAGREREQSLLRESLIQQAQRLRLGTERTHGWSKRAWDIIVQAAAIQRDQQLRSQAVATLAGLDAKLVERFPELIASALAFDPEGQHLLMAGVMQGKKAMPPQRWSRAAKTFAELGALGPGPITFDPKGTPCQLTLADGPACVLRELAGGRPLATGAMPPGRCDPSKPVHLAVANDATHFAAAIQSASEKGMVLAWSTDSSEPAFAWDGAATALAFDPQGELLAAGDDRGRVRVWSMDDGAVAATFEAGRTTIQYLAFSPDGRRLAIAGSGGTIALWDHGANLVSQLFGSEYDVAAAAFSPDGTLLASGGRGATRLWNVAAGRPLLDILAGDYVRALAFDPHGDTLAVSSSDGVTIWDVQDGRGIRTLRGLASPVVQVKFAGNEESLAAYAQNGQIAVWRLPSGRLRRTYEGPRGPYPDNAALAFSHDGRRLAASSGAEAKLWDLDGGVRAWKLPHQGLAEVLAFSSDGRLLLFRMDTDAGRRLGRVRDLLGPSALTPLYETDTFNKGVLACCATPDGACFIVTGNHEGPQGRTTRIQAFEAGTGRPRWERRIAKPQTSIGQWMDPLGRLLVVGGYHDTAHSTLLNIADGNVVEHLTMTPVGVGPGAELVIQHAPPNPSATVNVQALRRPEDSEPLVLLAIDNPGILRVVFNRAGNLVAWGNLDGTVTVCDLEEIRRKLAAIDLDW